MTGISGLTSRLTTLSGGRGTQPWIPTGGRPAGCWLTRLDRTTSKVMGRDDGRKWVFGPWFDGSRETYLALSSFAFAHYET